MAEGFDLGSARINIGVDNTGVVQGVAQAAQQFGAGMVNLIQQARQAAGATGGGSGGAGGVQIPIGVNPNPGPGLAQVQQQVVNAVSQINQQGKINIQIRADANQAVSSFNQVLTAANTARQIGDLRLNVTANVNQAQSSLDNARRALDNLRQGDHFTLNIDANAQRADSVLNDLQTRLKAAEARGAKIQVNLETREDTGILGSILGGAGRGVLRGSGLGEGFLFSAGAGIAATAGFAVAGAMAQVTRAMIEGAQAGIEYNSRLEQQRNILEHYVGSAARAEEAINRFRTASRGQAPDQDVQTAGATFTRISQGDVDRAEELVRLTTALASAHPELGFQSMQLAIQQLISGDFRAFEDRTNTSFGTVNRLVAQGKVGFDLYREAIKAAGGDIQLLDRNSSTFQAQSQTFSNNIQRLAGTLSRPLFDTLTQGLTQANQAFTRFGPQINTVAEFIGRNLVGAIQTAVPLVTLLQAGLTAVGTIADKLPGGGTQQQQQSFIVPNQREQLQGQLSQQQIALKDIEVQLARNQSAAAQIASVYGTQLAPLQQQIALLERTNYLLERRQLENARTAVRLDNREIEAQGPVDVRANVAASNVVLNAQRETLNIAQQRLQITQQLADAEADVARRNAETAIRAREQGVRLLQEQAAAAADARRTAVDAARDQADAEREARRDALDALRDQYRVQQQVRQDEIDGLREVSRQNQETRRQAIDLMREQADIARYNAQVEIDGLREVARQREEAYRDQRQQDDDAHRDLMDKYSRQIDRLRDRAEAAKETGRTEAEEALKQLELEERRYNIQKSINDARRSLFTANTLSEQINALARIREARHDAEVQTRREALQAQIDREREQQQQRDRQNQQQIADLERKAREEDRQYQDRKRQEDRAFEQQRRADQETIRQAEAAERARRQQEDQDIRAAEKADRAATFAEQERIRQLEAANKAQERTEQEAIRTQERADHDADVAARKELLQLERDARAADRADQERINAEQREIANARQALQDSEAARQNAQAQARLDILRQQAPIEQALLDNQKKLLNAQDTATLAQVAHDKVINETEGKLLANAAKLEEINAKLATSKMREDVDHLNDVINNLTIPLDANTKKLQAQQAAAEATARALQRQLELLASGGPTVPGSEEVLATDRANRPGAYGGATGGGINWDAILKNPAGVIASFAVKAVSSLVEGIQQQLNQDNQTGENFLTWINAALTRAEKEGLIIGSPSHRAEGWAQSVAEGLVGGLQAHQQEVTDAFNALFAIDSITPNVDALTQSIGQHLADPTAGIGAQIAGQEVQSAVQTAFGVLFPESGQSPWLGLTLDSFLSGIDLKLATDLPEHINSAGAQEGVQQGLVGLFPPAGQASSFGTVLDGWLAGIDQKLSDDLEGHIDSAGAEAAVKNGITAWFSDNSIGYIFDQVGQNFRVYGQNLATEFGNGFIQQMNDVISQQIANSVSSVQAYTGGSRGGFTGVSSGGATVSSGGSSGTLPGTNDITNYLESYGYSPGDPNFESEFNRLVDQIYNQGLLPPPDMRITGRAWGGPLDPHGLYLVGERQPELIDMGADSGRAYTADQLRSLLSGGGAGAQQIGQIGPINVSIDGSGMDAEQIAREVGPKIMREMVMRIDRAQRNAPTPVSRALPGAN